MALPSEIGLRLLLSPLGSNVVIRTACCSIGIGIPVFSTFKAIEKKDHNEQQKWLLYWAAYGSFSLAEVFSDKLLSWFPLYYYMKFAFLVWLQLPPTNGARVLYMNHLRPFLLRHQAKLDRIVEFLYSEMGKFISVHQSEFHFVKTIFGKILTSANQIVGHIVHPGRTQTKPNVVGTARQIEDSESEHED